MKAKLFITDEGKFQVRLSNGSQFAPKDPNESKESFMARMKEHVKSEFGEDLEPYKEITLKAMKAEGSAALQKRLPLLEPGVEAEMVTQILIARGLLKAEPVPEKDVSKPAKKAASKKATKTNKKPRVKKDKISLEEAQTVAAKAKKKVGKTITFQPFKADQKTQTGTIKGVTIDKRSMYVYFMIHNEAKKLFYKKTTDASIAFV